MEKDPPPIDFDALPGAKEIDDRASDVMWAAVEELHGLGLPQKAIVDALLMRAALEAGGHFTLEEVKEIAQDFCWYTEGVAQVREEQRRRKDS